jgi:malate/lactate dehydrogenase
MAVRFSVPSILGARGVEGMFEPRLDIAEQEALARSTAKQECD